MLVIIGSILIFALCVLLVIAAYQKITNGVCRSKKRLDGITAIVTGGTAGMGLEIAKDFALRGAKVIIACPFEEEGLNARKQIVQETANTNVIFKQLNLGSIASTRQFAADILTNEDRLDILVNNAGIAGPLKKSKDGINLIMQVNYFGPFLLTLLLLPLLRKSGRVGAPGRIVNTISVAHWVAEMEIERLTSCEEYYFVAQMYANSKLCMALFTHELSKRIQGWNVVVNNVDPGAVGTAIFQSWNKVIGYLLKMWIAFLYKTPWQGAQTAIHVSLDDKAGEASDGYYKNCRLSRCSLKAHDDKTAKKLWEESTRIMGLKIEELDACFKLV